MFTTEIKPRLRIYGVLYISWVLLFSVVSYYLHINDPWYSGTFSAWLNKWVTTDAVWYLEIAQYGYSKHNTLLVYPPGYSTLLRGLSTFLPFSMARIAQVLNLMAYFSALVLTTELFTRVFNLKYPFIFFALCLSTPIGYIAFSPYSDSLFMALVWAFVFCTVLHPKSRKSLVARIGLIMVIPWIRIMGYALLTTILCADLVVLLLPVSLGFWLWLNYAVSGDMFYFIESQKVFLMAPGSPLNGYWGAYLYAKQFFSWPIDASIFGVLPLFYFYSLLLVSAWMVYKKQYHIALVMLGIILLSHYSTFWRSAVRYDFPLMPCLFVPLFYGMVHSQHKMTQTLCKVAITLLFGLQFGAQIMLGNRFSHNSWAY